MKPVKEVYAKTAQEFMKDVLGHFALTDFTNESGVQLSSSEIGDPQQHGVISSPCLYELAARLLVVEFCQRAGIQKVCGATFSHVPLALR